MKQHILIILLSGMLSAAHADGILSYRQQAELLARPKVQAYDRLTADGRTHLSVYNVRGGGFVVTRGQRLVGYSDSGSFSTHDAPPALLALLQAISQDGADAEADAPMATTAVEPLLADIAWNQDAPYNDLCPAFDMGSRCPTGCVATAMAQLMRYHRWPAQGQGSHEYAPAILRGNTLAADFGSTTYLWDAMLPNYATATVPAEGYTIEQCREAVAQLMLHCGVAVDMVYYSQSGATDYDVPPALTTYFGYDSSMAYRKREHYATADWLGIIHDELAAGRPVLAYGRSASGGHAYVFDGMDDNGFIHVNWGWGGMSNGFFQTSALTPAAQGIGGSDGGFNYSQRIITGIRPADGVERDADVELTSTEGLTPGRQKMAQGATVSMRLSGKVANHGWRDATFDYALLLLSADGDTVSITPGPAAQTLAKDATDYAPAFGNVGFPQLAPGSYTLYPVCRTTGGKGPWLRIRDNYIGYVNRLDVTATATDISFSQPDYFRLKATDTDAPATIYSGVPTLITATVTNEGDVEYHGEVKAQLRQGSSIVSTTANYIVDLAPGASTVLRFTDAFTADAGTYTLCLVDDDGAVISPRLTTTVQTRPASGSVVATAPVSVVRAEARQMEVRATVAARGGSFCGLLYTFILSDDGRKEMGCLFPEYVALSDDGTAQQVVMRGTFENGQPGHAYLAQLYTYNGTAYTPLDDDGATQRFVFAPGEADAIGHTPAAAPQQPQPRYGLHGRRIGTAAHGIVVKDGRKIISNK